MSTLTLTQPAQALRRVSLADPETKGIALGLVAALIWGAYLSMAKAGVSAGLAATDIAFIRYGVAGFIMLPWLMRNGIITLGGVGYARGLALAALVGPLFILVGVGGYAFAPLAHGAILQPAALTIGSTVLAMMVFGDRPTLGRIIGIGIILGGLVAIAGPSLLQANAVALTGDGMFVAAGLMWAVFTMLTKRWSVAPIAATAIVSVLSAIIYVPGYLIYIGIDRVLAAAPAMLIAQITVQGVLSGVVAVIAFSKAAQLLGPARAAVFPAMVPAVAIILGVPVAGEVPTAPQLAGLALVSLGWFSARTRQEDHRLCRFQRQPPVHQRRQPRRQRSGVAVLDGLSQPCPTEDPGSCAIGAA